MSNKLFSIYPYDNTSSLINKAIQSTLHDFDLLSDSLLSTKHNHNHSRKFHIPLDIKENDKAYHIIADLPGFTKQDVKISVHEGNILVLEAERKQETKDEGVKYFRLERSTGYASRSLALPDNADHEKISAKYEDGVLTLTIDKKPEDKKEKVRSIEIQ
mmetsp:Transcript_16306/g.14731  ORF Transcript_16306/g.14731 Transcript_16306/m.14731 type:complete len:159 (+) Transcript_16306:65-541(+)